MKRSKYFVSLPSRTCQGQQQTMAGVGDEAWHGMESMAWHGRHHFTMDGHVSSMLLAIVPKISVLQHTLALVAIFQLALLAFMLLLLFQQRLPQNQPAVGPTPIAYQADLLRPMQDTSTNWFLQHPQSPSVAALVSCCGLKIEVTLKKQLQQLLQSNSR